MAAWPPVAERQHSVARNTPAGIDRFDILALLLVLVSGGSGRSELLGRTIHATPDGRLLNFRKVTENLRRLASARLCRPATQRAALGQPGYRPIAAVEAKRTHLAIFRPQHGRNARSLSIPPALVNDRHPIDIFRKGEPVLNVGNRRSRKMP